MAREAEVRLDIDAELVAIALEYAPLVERGAAMIADEIQDSITISEIPSPAGSPPHSKGPYRESWKSGKARRRGLNVAAWAYSLATVGTSHESLAEVLDEGRGPIEPHPHLHAAVARAQKAVDDEVRRVNRQLASGG